MSCHCFSLRAFGACFSSYKNGMLDYYAKGNYYPFPYDDPFHRGNHQYAITGGTCFKRLLASFIAAGIAAQTFYKNTPAQVFPNEGTRLVLALVLPALVTEVIVASLVYGVALTGLFNYTRKVCCLAMFTNVLAIPGDEEGAAAADEEGAAAADVRDRAPVVLMDDQPAPGGGGVPAHQSAGYNLRLDPNARGVVADGALPAGHVRGLREARESGEQHLPHQARGNVFLPLPREARGNAIPSLPSEARENGIPPLPPEATTSPQPGVQRLG